MENLLIVARQVVILFVLMGVGALARRLKLLDAASVGGIVNLLLHLVTPCLIVHVFQRPFDAAMLGSLGLAFVIAVAGHFVAIGLSRLLVRHPDEDTCRPLRLAAVFSNAGFMGIPLEQALFGERGVFYGVVYVVVFNLFMWSWGLVAMAKGGGGKGFRWQMLVNPGTIGVGLGLPLFFLSATLPEVIAKPIHLVSELNTPLAMIVIGYSLAGAKLGRVARMGAAYVASAVRLAVYPLLVVAAMVPFRHALDRDMMLAIAVAASAPVAAMVSMFAQKHGRDVDTSVAVVSATTLLSVVTMPLVIALAMEVL